MPDGYPNPAGVDAGKVIQDIAARVAGTDDEDVLAPVLRQLAEVRGVQQLAGKVIAARPGGDVRHPFEPGGDDDMARAVNAGVGLDCPAVIVRADARTLYAVVDGCVEPGRVVGEIADDAVARGIRSRGPRNRETR
jgi:hypothetical protein